MLQDRNTAFQSWRKVGSTFELIPKFWLLLSIIRTEPRTGTAALQGKRT
jgi:hypothetical protein